MKPAFKILNPKKYKVEPEHQEAMLFPNVQEIQSLHKPKLTFCTELSQNLNKGVRAITL